MALSVDTRDHGHGDTKESFRSCGRYALPRHAPPRHMTRDKSKVPSIPSRYEVILFEGQREHLGFGSHALRFEGASAEEMPGPGNYGAKKSFLEETLERSSWGIRGTGGFASRSKRFGARSMPSLPPPGLGCPGPGAYNAQSAVAFLKDPKNFNQAKCSSAFLSQRKDDTVKQLPGPGQYSPFTDPKDASAAQAAFKSTSRRLGGTARVEDLPGPGEYFNAQPPSPSGNPAIISFKEPTKPRVARVHPDLPTVDQTTRDVLGDFADAVGRECLGTIGMAAVLPGPGHYNQNRDRIWEGNLVSTAGWSSFQPGPSRTDWTPEDVVSRPGPGKYDPKQTVNEKVTSAISAFTSASERNKTRVSPAPGPAYYSPKAMPQSRSFRLPLSKDWT